MSPKQALAFVKKGKEIFFAAEAIGESPDVLVCKLVDLSPLLALGKSRRR